MANEATLMIERSPPISITVADGAGIEKGTFITLSDPFTGAATGANANAIVVGIAAEEKIASDGKTQLAIYTDGFFKVLAGGAIALGEMVESHSVAQEVVTATHTTSATANLIGRCMETVADTDTFLMELNPMTIKDPA